MSCPAISEICSSCHYIRPQVGFRIDKQSPLRTIHSKSFPTQNNRTIFPKPSPAQSHLSKSSPTQTTEPSSLSRLQLRAIIPSRFRLRPSFQVVSDSEPSFQVVSDSEPRTN